MINSTCPVPYLMFSDTKTNTGLVVKPTSYTNPVLGPTEPQRRIIKALAGGKGNYLVEHTQMNNRKVFRCLDKNKNIVGNRFSKVVVKNLVSKGMIIQYKNKYYLK